MIFIKRLTGAGTLSAALMLGTIVSPAQAGYVVTLTEQGGDVVANGSGPIDLTGLAFVGDLVGVSSLVQPSSATIATGPPIDGVTANTYLTVTGPSSYVFGDLALADIGSGDFVGIGSGQLLVVPPGCCVRRSPVGYLDLYRPDLRSSRRDARHLCMDVGRGAEPELRT